VREYYGRIPIIYNRAKEQTKCDAMQTLASYLFQLLFKKREKKQSRSFKNDASKRGGKKRDFDDAKILSSSQNVLLDHFFIAHTVLVLSLLSLVLVFFRDLSLSLFDYFTRAASHELRSASRGVYIPAPVDLLRGFHS
jgi:hypothetical protein